MVMNYAVGLPTVGGFGDVHTLVDLAVAAEQHGWDGVHLWDHVLYHESGEPVASPVVAAAAIAASTSRVRIILTVALPRRQVQDIVEDAAGIDALSRRRLTVLATIGSTDREYTDFWVDPDLRTRGRALDERLHRLVELWSQRAVPPGPPGAADAGRTSPDFAERRASTAQCPRSPTNAATAQRSSSSRQKPVLRRLAPGGFNIALKGATDGPDQAQRIARYAVRLRDLVDWKHWVGGVATSMPRGPASSPSTSLTRRRQPREHPSRRAREGRSR